MKKSGRYTFIIASDGELDHLCAEIYYDDKYIARISQEQGPQQKVLEFPGPGLVEDVIVRSVDLAGFRRALVLAERKLAGE